MKIELLNEKIITFLRDNISHPDNSFEGNWIYLDYPRVDATFPRISLTHAGDDTSPVGIGERFRGVTSGLYFTSSYDIDIWVKKGNVYTLNGTKRAGSRLRDYLTDNVLQKFMDTKKTYWLDDENIIDLTIDGVTTVPYMDEYELFRKTITLTFTHFRPKT